jgi:hypothetical protein
MKTRFWIETGLAGVSGLLCLLTLAWKDWIEEIFKVDPDNHSGSVEWLLVAGLCALALLFGGLARRSHRSSHQPTYSLTEVPDAA